jgi:hypothetical protein
MSIRDILLQAHSLHRAFAALTWRLQMSNQKPLIFCFALAALVMFESARATAVNVHEFTVSKNGTVLFTDSFDDGNEPPSAPNFTGGGAASYNVLGSISAGAESGGMLQIDSANGVLTANAPGVGRQETRVRLITNIDPANLTAGLKSDDTLSVSAIFSLTTPTGVLNPQYSVRFTDASASGVHQSAQVQVQGITSTGQTFVRFIMQDFDADTLTVLGSVLFAPPSGVDSILLSIERPDLTNDDFIGSFAYVSGGLVGARTYFGTAAQLFQGENFVRAEFNVSDGVFLDVPEPGSLVLLALGFAGLAIRRRLPHA